MLVKSFRARTAAGALSLVRDALGSGAAVLETRRWSGGVEVLAMAERPAASPPAGRGPVTTPAGSADATALGRLLRAQGFSPAIAERIALAAEANLDPRELSEPSTALAYARELVALMVPTDGPLAPGAVSLIALVGAPGAGKTTTMAKLAAHARLVEGRPVLIASADDRRLGGAEQAQAYARTLGSSFALTHDARDVDALRSGAPDGALVLLDTPGVARGDDETFARLGSLLSGLHSAEIELLLAADHDAHVLADTVRRFMPLRPGAIGATRLDEALRGGALVSTVARAGLPLRHLSAGPHVPDDFEAADPSRVALWSLPASGHARSAEGF